jgi:hypothetical protein
MIKEKNNTLNPDLKKNKKIKVDRERVLTKNGVDWVHGDLVLSSIAYQTLGVSEGNIRRRCSVALIVGYDFHSVMLPHTDT